MEMKLFAVHVLMVVHHVLGMIIAKHAYIKLAIIITIIIINNKSMQNIIILLVENLIVISSVLNIQQYQ